jgi:hypothetical protein
MFMKAMLGISPYNYPYLKLAKMLCLSYYYYVSLQKNWRRGQNKFCLELRGVGERGKGWGAGETNGPNNVYTYE